MNSPLVNALWLKDHLEDSNLRIADTRFILGQPDAGLEAYRAGHIPGSVFLDLERDLSAPTRPDGRGGRHPLPDPAVLAQRLSSLGIGDEHLVVVYDDPSSGQGFYAAHVWWLLRWLGHEGVAVLDGGLPAWMAAGGTFETRVPRPEPASFTPRVRPEMLVDAQAVKSRAANTALIDSRAPARYRGEVEPLDRKAGHIPGAINRDWSAGLEANGTFKTASDQRKRFTDALGDAAEVVLYCGSGVSACANLLALEIAGLGGAKLYAGSWSDWVSNDANPIATVEAP